ncbi:MAG: hypothetical protein MJ097_01570 [Dorea sp.]|nr:hypothetical protein [Dorea sp.]
MNFNNIILMLLIELATFYMVRNYIIKHVKKKWSIIVFHPTLAGILKKSLLAFHLFYAVYGILVFCPIRDTEANPIPLYALYQLLMHGKLEPLTLCLYNTILLFPVGLWIGEILKPARSKFLYKWTVIITGIVGLYLEYSQYVLEKGRPAADDLLCIVIASCAGIFFRDAYEKCKQYYHLLEQVVRNEKRKREKAKMKAEEAEKEKAKKALEAAEKEEKEKKEREELEEKKRQETLAARQKRKEALDPYVERVTESSVYLRLKELGDILVFFLLALVQWIAELVADRKPSEEDDYHIDIEESLDDEAVEGEPRWKKLKRENQKQHKNPMMKQSRRMKRAARRKLRSQGDVDAELDEVQEELEDQKERRSLRELEKELRINRMSRKIYTEDASDAEEDLEEDVEEWEEDYQEKLREYDEKFPDEF